MKGLGALLATAALSATAVLGSAVQLEKRALKPVTIKGNAFFVGDKRFYMRGVDYQPGGDSDPVDPLADVNICKRDIEKFKKLGLNTVRIYTIDNTANHDQCMSMLADAGIYLALDLNTPKYSVNRADPRPSYNDVYLQNVFATVDIFAKYDNTLLFFSGNEVINDAHSTTCAPFVKAVTRDIRQYINSRGYRKIPVGYSAADVADNRKEMADYMNCGTDDERSDFFAFNDYSWCDPASSFKISGWDKKVQNFSDYSIPLFLSEFGCIDGDRQFKEVASLYSEDMSSVFSGGLVYEYSFEGNKYGIVRINDDGDVEELEDFELLQKAFAEQKDPAGDGGYKKDGSPSQCPAASANWEVQNSSLPAIPAPAKKYLTDGAGTGAGLAGEGSQQAGTPSTEMATPGSGAVAGSSSGTSGAISTLAAPGVFGVSIAGAFVMAVLTLGL